MTQISADWTAERWWFDVLARACFPVNATAEHHLAADLSLPVVAGEGRFWTFRWRSLAGLSNYYTCRFATIGERPPDAAAIEEWAVNLRASAQAPASVRFDSLEEGPMLEAFAEGLRRAGYKVERFRHFGTWSADVRNLDFDAYWAARPAALRNTVARKDKTVNADASVEMRCFETPADADAAIAFYETVSGKSWQGVEPHPYFAQALIRAALEAGAGRVWGMTIGDTPAAAQIWLSGARRATLFKLAYDQRYKRYSPGTLLTRAAIENVIESGEADEIDFGRGDDPYKRDWAPNRRQLWGVAGYDTARPAGIALALRNLLPKIFQ